MVAGYCVCWLRGLGVGLVKAVLGGDWMRCGLVVRLYWLGVLFYWLLADWCWLVGLWLCFACLVLFVGLGGWVGFRCLSLFI